MGKLAEKQIALARQILGIQDEATLDSVDQLLNSGVRFTFTEAEINVFQERLERYETGKSKGASWPEVKKRVRRQLRG